MRDDQRRYKSAVRERVAECCMYYRGDMCMKKESRSKKGYNLHTGGSKSISIASITGTKYLHLAHCMVPAVNMDSTSQYKQSSTAPSGITTVLHVIYKMRRNYLLYDVPARPGRCGSITRSSTLHMSLPIALRTFQRRGCQPCIAHAR